MKHGLFHRFGRRERKALQPIPSQSVAHVFVLGHGPQFRQPAGWPETPPKCCPQCERDKAERGDVACFLSHLEAVCQRARKEDQDQGPCVWDAHPAPELVNEVDLEACHRAWRRGRCAFVTRLADPDDAIHPRMCPYNAPVPAFVGGGGFFPWVSAADVLVLWPGALAGEQTATILASFWAVPHMLETISRVVDQATKDLGAVDASNRGEMLDHLRVPILQCRSVLGTWQCVAVVGALAGTNGLDARPKNAVTVLNVGAIGDLEVVTGGLRKQKPLASLMPGFSRMLVDVLYELARRAEAATDHGAC